MAKSAAYANRPAPRADIKDVWVAYKKGPTQQLRNVLEVLFDPSDFRQVRE